MANKRSYGSGSLVLRGSIWYYRFYDQQGNRVQGPTGETSKKSAEAVMQRKIAEHNGATERFAQSVQKGIAKYTISDLLKKYSDVRSETEKGIGSDQYIINRSLIPFFGNMEVRKLNTQDTIAYRDYRKSQLRKNGDNAKPATPRKTSKPPSNATIDRELRILKAATRMLWKQGSPLMPYPIHVHLSNEDNKRKGFISPDVFIDKLLPCLQPHMKNLIALMYCSGMRSGEALALNQSHVDLNSGIIYVIDSKNGQSREVPIFDGLMRSSIENQISYCKVMSPGEDAMFTFSGKRMTHFKRSWKTAINQAGLPNLIPHDLRRSAAKNMRNAGIPGQIIMTIMGHSSMSLLTRYSIVDSSDIKNAKEKMDIHSSTWKQYASSLKMIA